MTWSDAARAAALEARRMHARGRRATLLGPTVYHGSDVRFTKFNPAKMGTRTDPGFFGVGAYLVDDKANAGRWGKYTLKASVRLKNPLHVSGITDFVAKAGQRQVSKSEYANEMRRVTSGLLSRGHDGVVYHRADGKTQYVSFRPAKQVKIMGFSKSSK